MLRSGWVEHMSDRRPEWMNMPQATILLVSPGKTACKLENLMNSIIYIERERETDEKEKILKRKQWGAHA